MTPNKPNNKVKGNGDLKVTGFHCSEHGYIKPKPTCPKCSTSSYEQGVRDEAERIEKGVRSKGVNRDKNSCSWIEIDFNDVIKVIKNN